MEELPLSIYGLKLSLEGAKFGQKLSNSLRKPFRRHEKVATPDSVKTSLSVAMVAEDSKCMISSISGQKLLIKLMFIDVQCAHFNDDFGSSLKVTNNVAKSH